jgi:hypothetical protein
MTENKELRTVLTATASLFGSIPLETPIQFGCSRYGKILSKPHCAYKQSADERPSYYTRMT